MPTGRPVTKEASTPWRAESNFFPGRRFESMADLNAQALEWATKRMAQRPVDKTHLIPVAAFEIEKPYLIQISPYIHPPYDIHYRLMDQYGYISFSGNFYWVPQVPDLSRQKVKVLQYSDSIQVYFQRKLLVRYELPPEGVRNQKFTPPDQTPKYQPWNRKKPKVSEEKILRTLSDVVNRYLDFALHQSQKIGRKHHFIRQLYGLYRRLAPSLFLKTIQRALTYRITHPPTTHHRADGGAVIAGGQLLHTPGYDRWGLQKQRGLY